MATPESFGKRKHHEFDGCDDDSIRHRMGMQAVELQNRLWPRTPGMGVCMVEKEWGPCGNPVMEEEFDCGKHGASK